MCFNVCTLRTGCLKNNVYKLSRIVWGQVGVNKFRGRVDRNISFITKSALVLWLAEWGEPEILQELTSEISYLVSFHFPRRRLFFFTCVSQKSIIDVVNCLGPIIFNFKNPFIRQSSAESSVLLSCAFAQHL